MREPVSPIVEEGRMVFGPHASIAAYGPNGRFLLKGKYGWQFAVIASNGSGWEHVSVHVIPPKGQKERLPTWTEMCYIKELFWEDDEAVMQLHPPKSRYVNTHPYVLHLWRPIGVDILQPPLWMV